MPLINYMARMKAVGITIIIGYKYYNDQDFT